MSVFRVVTIVACLCFPLTWAAAHDTAASQDAWVTEAVSFRSPDGVHLSGSLVTPRNGNPVAVVVLGPGGFPGERYINLAALMALRGIAVLTYDKRGVGKSGGPSDDARNISASKLALMASDAAAAMQWISRNSHVQSLPRGFIAISQSGWVIPLALGESPKVDFLGFWSGPGCTTSEQLHFQKFSEAHGYDRSKITDAEIREVMRHVNYRADDVDPLTPLKDISIPALWLFGGHDPWVPIELSTSRLQGFIDKGKSNFGYRVFPGEGHDLADSSSQPSFIAMVEWVKQIASSRLAPVDPK
jgi:uncharacterized protein